MEIRPTVLLVIAGMAVVTYVTKAGGLWLMGKIEISGRIEAWLEALPGAVIVAIIAPSIVTGGAPEWIAAAVVLLVAWKTENILLAMVVGVGAVLTIRELPAVV